MKVIIIGVGKVGYTVAEQLVSEKHDVVLVDIDRDALSDALSTLDAISIHGNGATSEVQKAAGAEEAQLVIALTGSDELNLLCCLIAKKLGVKSAIARVRNPEYHDDLKTFSDTLGLSMAVNPEYEAAMEILRILKFPTAINVDAFSKGRIDLVSFSITGECILAGKKIKESFSNPDYDVLACAVERQEEVFIPNGDFVIEAGDIVAAMIHPEQINSFFKFIGNPVKKVKKVMIVGGGVIAEYLTEQLVSLNMDVTIIEKKHEIAERLSFLFPQANIVCADGTNRSLLLEEGLCNMDALCSLTGFDEENILLSLYAKTKNPEIKTITKVNKMAFQEVTGILDIGSVVYPKYTTANKILQHVRVRQNNVGSNVETLYKIIDNKVEALEFRVSEDSAACGKTLIDLEHKAGVLIGSITRDKKPFIPHGRDRLQAGDLVVVVTTIAGLSDFDSILGDTL